MPNVSLVIPGRNCAATLAQCLHALDSIRRAVPSALREIIFVDDHSTDDSVTIAESFNVTVLKTHVRGPGAARNTGWRHATSDLIWFIDSDCVAEPDALDHLLDHMKDTRVAAVSGSYGIMNPHSLLASLIHEEIIHRHRRMPTRVNFLATFNVLYRRTVLAQLDGFDEHFLKGQDAELSFRATEAGFELHFDFNSRVKHFHEERWLPYFRTQQQQGYWRVYLHAAHRGHARGDSYSSLIDHIQPPLAMLSLLSLPTFLLPAIWWLPLALVASLLLCQVPITLALVFRCRSPKYLAYAFMSFLRAYWRGVGMTAATLALLAHWLKPRNAHNP